MEQRFFKEVINYRISEQIYNAIIKDAPWVVDIDNPNEIFNHFRRSYKVFRVTQISHSGVENIKLYITYRTLKALSPSNDFQPKNPNAWITLRLDNQQEDTVIEDTNGKKAWNFIMKILQKYYTKEQIDETLKSYKTEENKPWHEWLIKENPIFVPMQEDLMRDKIFGFVFHINNCIYYDMNKAHSDALSEMFPKIKDELIDLAVKSKENKNYKAYPNYFIGMLQRKGYHSAYYWVVERTRKIVKNYAINIGGEVIYANTDGFILHNPKKVVPSSSKLGEFKLEYQGDVYIANAKHGWYLQYGKSLKSNVPVIVRNKLGLDLSKGQVADFVQKEDSLGKKIYNNIKKVTVEVREYE